MVKISICILELIIIIAGKTRENYKDNESYQREMKILNVFETILKSINSRLNTVEQISVQSIKLLQNMNSRQRLLDFKIQLLQDNIKFKTCCTNKSKIQNSKNEKITYHKRSTNFKRQDIIHNKMQTKCPVIRRITRNFKQMFDKNKIVNKYSFTDKLFNHSDQKLISNLTKVIKLIQQLNFHTDFESQIRTVCNQKCYEEILQNIQLFIKISTNMEQLLTMANVFKNMLNAILNKSGEAINKSDRKIHDIIKLLDSIHNQTCNQAGKMEMIWKNNKELIAEHFFPSISFVNKKDRIESVTNFLVSLDDSTTATYNLSYNDNLSRNLSEKSLKSENENLLLRNVHFPSIQNQHLQTTTDFLVNTQNENKKIQAIPQTTPSKGYNCADLIKFGYTKSDIYYIQIKGASYWYLRVYCEMQLYGGGWTLIQRRNNYGEPKENFNRDWETYRVGFGDLDKEFWLGNENIYMLTNSEDYILRIELEDFEKNTSWAQYSTFKLYSEDEDYKLEVSGYEGEAGDSLSDPWYGCHLRPFSTYNRDNDISTLNCASMLKGGWWWRSCGRGLNGVYFNNPNDANAKQGIVWFKWKGWEYNLKSSSMMIRPKSFNEDSHMIT